MNPNLPKELRCAADSLLEFTRRQSPEITGIPRRIQVVYEAADELEQQREVLNEAALLRMTAKYLGTTPERLRELVRVDKEGSK